ncbi:hypothetical protein AXF42_Ash006104 [Apostasia shenzhenica]|uniref:Galactose oxidase n=1 Tax=Apostasia shenzhenica TaxID=1088818 RepID=A0A2I0B086_9ASPA|nr:hypothetical protein AXF42_Ash006104 [Apostasia shenzhenica]
MRLLLSPAILLSVFLVIAGDLAAAQLTLSGGGLLTGPASPEGERLDYKTQFSGAWEVVSADSGVSAMHLAVTRENKAIMFDATIFGASHARLPANMSCRPDINRKNESVLDCYAHAVEFDLKTYRTRVLKAILGDGSFVVLGGRRSFNYEFVPPEAATSSTLFDLRFLRVTTDGRDENNLYPFIHLSTDGNLFVFANNRSILLQPRTGRVLREFPVLPGGSRNYPASGMSVLLPLVLRHQRSVAARQPAPFPAQVLICGGAPHESFHLVDNANTFLPALKSCGRLTITDANANWVMEDMPIPRTIGDMLLLPNGDVLLINGARTGCSGWDFARDPVLAPLLYKPGASRVTGLGRWKELAPTAIPRMYHSTSAVLPDASILVSGSNTNPRYNFTTLFPTELRVEKFRPPYLDPALAAQRPEILAASVPKEITYTESFTVEFTGAKAQEADVKVTMYAPPFTTHGFSMNQRLLVLRVEEFRPVGNGNAAAAAVKVLAPPSGDVAPPGWYMLFVVCKGLPSDAAWIHIQAKL